MEDNAILDLYFSRSEQAISETAEKYGGYCYCIAYNILENHEDAEESVSDTYLSCWNYIPPKRPNLFSAFLAKLTRHLSIDRWRSRSAAKRGGGALELALEELTDMTDGQSTEDRVLRREQLRALNRAMDALNETERSIFLCRYFYLDSNAEIADHFQCTEGRVKTMLSRTRAKLRLALAKEGLL
ncbi:MAG: sigma-70 family RNA polymerase sigma factor [Eubacteriales bacterium]|nr:sigma-70 family RNA polymerase sigma factor [Eubacteriales bacterium]